MRQVFCTCPEAEAEGLARALLEDRLVACVQIMPVKSLYWWRGKIESSAEVLLMMKTRGELMAKLIARIRQLHSYEVPEIVAVRIEEGNPAYLEWLSAETLVEACKVKT
jgi:periplasmic divalent cation tolerance protein